VNAQITEMRAPTTPQAASPNDADGMDATRLQSRDEMPPALRRGRPVAHTVARRGSDDVYDISSSAGSTPVRAARTGNRRRVRRGKVVRQACTPSSSQKADGEGMLRSGVERAAGEVKRVRGRREGGGLWSLAEQVTRLREEAVQQMSAEIEEGERRRKKMLRDMMMVLKASMA
jgi:hypothetical protein